ncbi:anaphase-promoting complex subunit 10-like isoform X1 [Dipodomys merriami]|uniref:anaphase-promoting complex subunit 10-like isoform X1 n=1 Tax=Dipodomys merriami TaxID=94247 RepID=UPI00384E5C24
MTTSNRTPPGADPTQLERTGTVREIGSPGFGVDRLRDGNLETNWQSDGSQPHLVNIQFSNLDWWNQVAGFMFP